MKKALLLLSTIVIASCSVEKRGQEEITYNNLKFYASTESTDGTRTYLNDEGRICWTHDDRVSIFVGSTYNQQFAYQGQTGVNGEEFSPVDNPSSMSGEKLHANYAVYPYAESNVISEDGILSIELPQMQTYAENSFGPNANTMVAVTENVQDNFLYFKNACGYLRLSLYGDASIQSITLKGNRGEKISGATTVDVSYDGDPRVKFSDDGGEVVTIDCGEGVVLGSTEDTASDFYFVIPPVVFTEGITITATATDGRVFEKTTSTAITVERNKISKMRALEYRGVSDKKELTFYAEEKSTIALVKTRIPPDSVTLEYKTDSSDWTSYSIGTVISLNAGESLCFRAGENGNRIFSNSDGSYYKFAMSGKVCASGNIMSLLDRSMKKTSVPKFAFTYLFSGCTSLTSSPELPATTLASHCYDSMFYECSNLTSAPELPATTLAEGCYANMFNKCYSLTSAPELPATTLASRCYDGMFNNCHSLNSAPELPATTLANYCYENMFNSCHSLTSAPELPATTLAFRCYNSMFCVCRNLTSAPELPATTLANECYLCMFEGCTSLTSVPDLPATTLAEECYYNMFHGCTSLTSAPELPATTLAEECYHDMFSGCTSLNSAPKLPATTLASRCYDSMFCGCTSLASAPELLATTLAPRCYDSMFCGCTSLASAPELPATTLAEGCYANMFNSCNSLTSAPELPATTLVSRCYHSMFYGCTSLTSAPELPATTLAKECYYYMFYGCSELNYVKMMATDIWASNCLSVWLNGVSSTGTFVKNATAKWEAYGSSGIPNGWVIVMAEN